MFILQKFLICILKKGRLNLHDIRAEAVPEVSDIPWRLHELSAALESCRNPDGERQRERKKRTPKLYLQPVVSTRCGVTVIPNYSALSGFLSWKVADPHMVPGDLLLCAIKARLHATGTHLNGRSSHPRGDSDLCSHLSAPPSSPPPPPTIKPIGKETL